MNKRKKEQLVILFQKELKRWEREKEVEHYHLKMKLVNLVSDRVSFGTNDFWERIVSKILVKGEEMNLTPRQVIENLFKKKDSEDWILAFQDLGK